MPLYLRYGLAAALLAVVGWSLWEYFESVYALVMLPLMGLGKKMLVYFGLVLMRIGLRRAGLVVIATAMPVLWRRGRRNLTKASDVAALYWRYAKMRWRSLPWQAWVAVSICGCVAACFLAGLSGLILFLLSFMPPSVNAAIGGWINRKVVPVLARFAAAKGAVRLFPVIWTKIPNEVRAWCAPRYRKLFWWTMRRLIRRRRQALARRKADAMFVRQMQQHP